MQIRSCSRTLPLARRPYHRGALLGWSAGGIVLALLLGWSSPAQAIPAFARKYGTSCLTCHTVYPKLTPFGEAFRRNGFRFPGTDSDFVKQDPVPLGQEAYKELFPAMAWPGTVASSVPIAVGFNGQAVVHPSKTSGAAVLDNGARFSLDNLMTEGHLWAGGSFDDKTTFFGEITFSSDHVEIEHARVQFNDLVGPKHAVNLSVGKQFASLSSFGPHSSYVADVLIPPLAVSGLYGSADPSWNVADKYNSIELTSIIKGRFNMAVGIAAGANAAGVNPGVANSNNVYAHAGYKLGGMRLDGEGAAGPANPMKPWAERSLTLDVFAYHAESTFGIPSAATPPVMDDKIWSYGAGLRAQLDSLELDAGIYQERHSQVLADGTGVHALSNYEELSYVVFPWMVPALRIEISQLQPTGGASIHDLRIIPGIAFLVRPNLKLSLIGLIEQANGMPDGGWGSAGGFAAPKAGSVKEIESIVASFAFAF
jgi:hypothetical protein